MILVNYKNGKIEFANYDNLEKASEEGKIKGAFAVINGGWYLSSDFMRFATDKEKGKMQMVQIATNKSESICKRCSHRLQCMLANKHFDENNGNGVTTNYCVTYPMPVMKEKIKETYITPTAYVKVEEKPIRNNSSKQIYAIKIDDFVDAMIKSMHIEEEYLDGIHEFIQIKNENIGESDTLLEDKQYIPVSNIPLMIFSKTKTGVVSIVTPTLNAALVEDFAVFK
jgi:hypothetical protein